MNLRATVKGDLRKSMDQIAGKMQAAARFAVVAGGAKGQEVLRAQTASAGLGAGVARAWRLKVYPSSGRADNPSAYVYSNARRIVSAFAFGVTITAKKAQWLMIPLPAAIDAGLDRMQGRPGGSTRRGLAKWSDEDAAVRKFGDLRFVPIKGGRTALLVADVGVRSGKKGQRFAKLGQRNTKRGATVPLFLLVRRVRLGKLLDIDAAQKQAFAETNARFNQALTGG